MSTVLITGAGQRIGLTLALGLKADGFDVIATYRSQRPGLAELEAAGVELVHCDFALPGATEGLVDHIQSHYPHLRAIIHNASDWQAEDFSNPDPGVFDRMMAIHGKVPYLLNLALAENLEEGGDIIHLTDRVAETGSRKHIAYAASKAALENLTLSFAQRLAPRVKVNSIAPAMIQFNEGDDETYRAKALAKALLPIEPGFGEILSAVRYLLQSRYVTGRILNVDGGRHLK